MKGKCNKNINTRLEQAEERICEIEDRNFKIIQSKENKEKKNKKNSDESQCNLWNGTIQRTILQVFESQKEQKVGGCRNK